MTSMKLLYVSELRRHLLEKKVLQFQHIYSNAFLSLMYMSICLSEQGTSFFFLACNLVCNEEKWHFSPEFRKVHCSIFRNKRQRHSYLYHESGRFGRAQWVVELLFYFCNCQFLQKPNSNYNLLP